jgi:hypothetical protein
MLTAIAGWVDAIGFISLGGFDVSFMSGNTTRSWRSGVSVEAVWGPPCGMRSAGRRSRPAPRRNLRVCRFRMLALTVPAGCVLILALATGPATLSAAGGGQERPDQLS